MISTSQMRRNSKKSVSNTQPDFAVQHIQAKRVGRFTVQHQIHSLDLHDPLQQYLVTYVVSRIAFNAGKSHIWRLVLVTR